MELQSPREGGSFFDRYSKQEREETKADIFFLFIEKFREIKGRKSVEVGKMLPVSRDESR